MKVLITGSAGFIGSALTARLLDEGYQVFGYDTKVHSTHDILDKRQLRGAVADVDCVVHCAAIAGIDTVGKSPCNTAETNIIGTWNVLSAASFVNNLKRFVFFSTSEIYGAEAFRVAEDSPASIGPVGYARWVYAASKLAGEHMTKAFHTQYGMPTVTVRPFNVYGPGQIGDSAMKTFIENALKGEKLIVRGSGDQTRCWCYISDFIDGLMPLLFDDRAIGESFNIGNERAGESIYELACDVLEVTGSTSEIDYDHTGKADIRYRVPSVQKIMDMFGYSPKIGLKEGIRKTEEWIRHEGTR